MSQAFVRNARSDGIALFILSMFPFDIRGQADDSPSVACSIGVAHQSRPVVGVIALPFLNQIVRPSPDRKRSPLITSTQHTKVVEHS